MWHPSVVWSKGKAFSAIWKKIKKGIGFSLISPAWQQQETQAWNPALPANIDYWAAARFDTGPQLTRRSGASKTFLFFVSHLSDLNESPASNFSPREMDDTNLRKKKKIYIIDSLNPQEPILQYNAWMKSIDSRVT